MKIVHIYPKGNSGSSAAARRLNCKLQEYGVKSFPMELDFSKRSKNYNIVKNSILILKNRLIYGRVKMKPGYPFFTSEIKWNIKEKEEIKNADIIHIHWTESFYSFENYKWILSLGKKVVWTCHDSWIFTGGCCVKEGCEKYKEGCNQCKYITGGGKKDISYWHYNKKKKLFCEQNITFIAPSEWMDCNLKNSFLKEKDICKISNIPNYNIFYRKTDEEIIKRFQDVKKDDTKINILFGADSLEHSYKGTKDVIETLQLLYQQEDDIVNKVRICILGSGWAECEVINHYEHYYLGYIDNEYDMSCAYSLADILMFPSHDDNLPYMVIESLACGTPVLAYAIGGIPEIIEHKKSGYLVNEVSAEKFSEGLKWLMENQLDHSIVAKSVRKRFDEKEIVEQHIQLYSELL